MAALPLQLVATLDNLTHNTQHALLKAHQLNAQDVPEISADYGDSDPFKDVCEYVSDLVTLTKSGSGLSTSGKVSTKGEQYSVYTSFETFSKWQQELFAALIVKAADVGMKAEDARLVAYLKEYENTFDTFIRQLADQCPIVAADITSERQAVDEVLKKAVTTWSSRIK